MKADVVGPRVSETPKPVLVRSDLLDKLKQAVKAQGVAPVGNSVPAIQL